MASPISSTRPRRFLRTRQRAWAAALARGLGRMHVKPNHVSVAGVAFALAAGAALVESARADSRSGQSALLVIAAACVQLRLLSNMLDGMLAIEGGLHSPVGDIYNDLPDRIADAVILVAAGYAVGWWSPGPAFGWCAALLAVMTAYVRLLGGTLGTPQFFSGPMAKQHRMFVMTVACLVAAGEAIAGQRSWALVAGLSIVIVGAAFTVAVRTRRIARDILAR